MAMAGAGGAGLPDETKIFEYENLKAVLTDFGKITIDGLFSAVAEKGSLKGESSSGYVRLRYYTDNKEERKEPIEKIHLSITTTELDEDKATEKYIEKAWNAMLPTIVKYKVICSKVYVVQTGEKPEAIGQKGKAIVFYIRNEKEVESEHNKRYWSNFLKEVETCLLTIEEGLGHKISGERPILRYKNETAAQAEAIRDTRSRFENPIGDSRFFYYSQELSIGAEVPAVSEMLSGFKADERAVMETTSTRTFTSALISGVGGGSGCAAADKTT